MDYLVIKFIISLFSYGNLSFDNAWKFLFFSIGKFLDILCTVGMGEVLVTPEANFEIITIL